VTPAAKNNVGREPVGTLDLVTSLNHKTCEVTLLVGEATPHPQHPANSWDMIPKWVRAAIIAILLLLLLPFIQKDAYQAEITVEGNYEEETCDIGYSPPAQSEFQSGRASWYGNEFHGRTTASGEVFDETKLTAAHLTLPFGTWLCVRRVGGSDVVRLRITDRGPATRTGRELDLSRAAFEALAPLSAGVLNVEWSECGGFE